MTERIISHRTWSTTEQGPDKLPVHVTYTETVVLRDMTDEERRAIREDRE